MATSLTSRLGRGLNLPITEDISTQIADEEKGDQMIKSTFDLLERGEKEIVLDDKHRDVILILGNTGSGKSTFTQWLAGDNTKLISEETNTGSGDYIIKDNNRIGDTTLKSKTIFPELVVDAKKKVAYYDCPGFSDTEGASHDIAATYFIKKVIDHSKSVKMVFTISHFSVRKGVDRQDFMKLVRHVLDLVKDVEKFKHSIAMIATKVDNQYIKQGKNFILVEDDKVIAAIADFLEEAKQYLEDNSERANISEKERLFFKNAMKFVDILLEKENEEYSKIGIFRRPDEPGPVSDIALLQRGKKDVERIVYEKLNFTVKNDEDFGYTVSDKTKNGINEIVEKINENLWSKISDIAVKIQEYYQNMVELVRDKIHLFVSDASSIDVSSSEAEAFMHEFSKGYLITSESVNKLKNFTNTEQLAVVINGTISNLDIEVSEDDVLYIENQGKYFSFFLTVSDKELSSKTFYQLFQGVETFFASSKAIISRDVNSAGAKINNRIQINLNKIAKVIREDYTEKMKLLEIQNLPNKLNRDSRLILKFTEEMKNGTTTGKLVRSLRYVVNDLGGYLPIQKLQYVENQGKYLKFLEVLGDGSLNIDPIMWLSPFENVAKYFYESQKWYTFLSDLYNKFSEYDIQKDRKRFNVASLEDWNQSEKPQGIYVTPNTFEKFLYKISNYNVSEYEDVKKLTAVTNLQIEELNQILSSTLKHRPTIICSESSVIVNGSFISLNETMQNLISNSDKNNNCKNFEAQLEKGKYKLFKFLALNKVFIDTDLSFSSKRISVAIIAPKWEVIGPRRIDLNGSDGAPPSKPKAKNGSHPGNNGANGLPGNPGTSGETFFGIGATFAGGAKLKINSNGGKGGLGQAGGDGESGVPGKDAINPSENDPPCADGRFREFTCVEVSKETFKGVGSVLVETTERISGLTGGRGGNGGNGGKGGNGGDPGRIEFVELSRVSDIRKLSSKGERGENGKGGAGGEGGRNGDDIIAEFSRRFITLNHFSLITKWTWKETIKNGIGPSGSKGTDGANAAGIEDPVPANKNIKLPNIINEYKMYLRKNLNDRSNKSSLLQFLELLSNSEDVRKRYDILALIDEFQGLEEQVPTLSDQIDFSAFYGSLLERISCFSKRFQDGAISNENKKLLNYLYTATLGRISNLRENSEQNLIIDIRGYLNVVKENIKTLKDLQTVNNKVDAINKYKENYKKGIDKKTEEAKSFIKRQIIPEIEIINTEVDGHVNALIEEAIALQKQAEKDWQKLADKKKELENAVARKGLFSIFNIVGGILGFLGPIGAIAGTVIEATKTVGESFALNNQQKSLNLPSDVVSAIATIGDQIKEMRNRKVAYLNKLLDNVSEEINKHPEKLSDMKGKIDDMKEKLKKSSEKKVDIKQIKALENELKRELERKKDELKIHAGDKKSIDALKVIGNMTKIVEFGSLLLNVYVKMKEDKEKMDAVTDAMEKIEDKIKELREYEENIYDTIVPMLQEMEDHMKDISDKLGTKSQVALDITKWQVQSTLKDMKLQMRRLTEGFEVKNDVSRSIEKLDEAMNTMVNIYDRIQTYQDQQNLANYIADISSVSANSINMKNQQLGNIVNQLEFRIRANMVLKQYKSAIDAFKQWVFPFADLYVQRDMLPSQLELDTNIQNLVQNAIAEIETIKQKLDLYDASVKNGDQFLECEEFSSRYVSSQPFFVWKHEEYRSSISDLLSGKETVLKADIKGSMADKGAIKFSEIEFEFKLKNETAQQPLSETLKGFDIRATHLGNSYYRYNDKITLITSDSVTISYSYEKDADGIPIRSNDVYNKLKSGDLLLSPYASWEVKLINRPSKFNYSFRDLEKYKNEMDVELAGFGRYVETNAFTPATHKSFIMYNSTNSLPANYKATGLNQCRRSKYRLTRSPEEFALAGDFMTNGAPRGKSSPIGLISSILQTYLIRNAIISLYKSFIGGKISVRHYENCSEVSHERRENGCQNLASSRTITDSQKICATSVENDSNKERTGQQSDTIFSFNFNGNNSCSDPSLLSDRKDVSSNNYTQFPDLNCSLLLADVLTRNITGKRYKAPTHECLLSPAEVIVEKINDGVIRSESDIKNMLQRHLSEKEETSNSVFSKIKGFAKSMFQMLGFEDMDDAEMYVDDLRNLFV